MDVKRAYEELYLHAVWQSKIGDFMRCQSYRFQSPTWPRVSSESETTKLVNVLIIISFVSQLPGHKGSVNEAVFHPKEPIIASCGSDKQIYLGEFDPSVR